MLLNSLIFILAVFCLFAVCARIVVALPIGRRPRRSAMLGRRITLRSGMLSMIVPAFLADKSGITFGHGWQRLLAFVLSFAVAEGTVRWLAKAAFMPDSDGS